jgi:hypothetical protein
MFVCDLNVQFPETVLSLYTEQGVLYCTGAGYCIFCIFVFFHVQRVGYCTAQRLGNVRNVL